MSRVKGERQKAISLWCDFHRVVVGDVLSRGGS